ncbi:hypothetical protein KIW84_051187 [Lathyrus oleraceus]|uniref:Cellular nucleic acid-binding protein n=1 Tax=Pisum sativum TaxID=3888 RepID=A0A9D5AAD2_PEA|nr:hypothetical protein KIW84_051187 [Pisum sativum]
MKTAPLAKKQLAGFAAFAVRRWFAARTEAISASLLCKLHPKSSKWCCVTLPVLIVLACWVFRREIAGRGRDDAAIAEALGMLAGVLGGNPNVVGLGAARQLSEFQKNNPPMFKGAYDPDGAQKWLKEIERIF